MERKTFLLQLKSEEGFAKLKAFEKDIIDAVLRNGCTDFSVWRAENMIFGYCETEDHAYPSNAGATLRALFEGALSDAVSVISLFNMRLMYRSIHHPLTDKNEVKAHRVFICRVKPGCMEEYRRRHEGLEVQEQEGLANGTLKDSDFDSSNFTIWNGGDYICGYNETDRIPEADDVNAGGNEVWEKNMLKIMDWLTDDADIYSGEHHEKIQRVF